MLLCIRRMTSDEQQHCSTALRQLHTESADELSWTRDLEKIGRAPQVVDGGDGGGGRVVVDQRLRWSMRGTMITV